MTETAPAVVMINVFRCRPEHQQRVIDLLRQALATVMSKQPGYLSGRVHRSLDGAGAAVYARWRSRDDFTALAGNAEAAAHMQRVRALATFEPVLYEVVLDHEIAAGPEQPAAGSGRVAPFT